MPAQTSLRVFVAALLSALFAPICFGGTPCVMDPVTTFTNGIALPSSDPYRSHNIYWQCDPYRHGCCGGQYQFPCLKSALFPNRCCGDFPTYLPGDDCRYRAGSFENVESEGVVTLGNLPAPAFGAAGGVAPQGRL